MAVCESARSCGQTATVDIPMFMGRIRVCAACEAWYGAITPVVAVVRVGDYVRVRDLGVVGYVERISRAGWHVVRYLLEIDGSLSELLAYRGRGEIDPI